MKFGPRHRRSSPSEKVLRGCRFPDSPFGQIWKPTQIQEPSMSKRAAKPIPAGFRTLTPHIVCKDAAKALEFYKRAFGAEEVSRLVGRDGLLLHAAMRIGDSVLMLADECPPMGAFSPLHFSGSPVTIHLSVPDSDALLARATGAGATPVMPVAALFRGGRHGAVKE